MNIGCKHLPSGVGSASIFGCRNIGCREERFRIKINCYLLQTLHVKWMHDNVLAVILLEKIIGILHFAKRLRYAQDMKEGRWWKYRMGQSMHFCFNKKI